MPERAVRTRTYRNKGVQTNIDLTTRGIYSSQTLLKYSYSHIINIDLVSFLGFQHKVKSDAMRP